MNRLEQIRQQAIELYEKPRPPTTSVFMQIEASDLFWLLVEIDQRDRVIQAADFVKYVAASSWEKRLNEELNKLRDALTAYELRN